MFQPDLFAPETMARSAPPAGDRLLDLPAILKRLTKVSKRPRYSFMVLNLIVDASGQDGSAGPYVRDGERWIPVRDWLCDALAPVAQRDHRRRAITDDIRRDLAACRRLPDDPEAAERLVEAQVLQRIRASARTNVSRAVSELVRAGLVQRHYQGYRVDHHNRGAQRQAVYTVTEEAKRALRGGPPAATTPSRHRIAVSAAA